MSYGDNCPEGNNKSNIDLGQKWTNKTHLPSKLLGQYDYFALVSEETKFLYLIWIIASKNVHKLTL